MNGNATIVRNRPLRKSRPEGIWSMAATWAMMILLGLYLGGFLPVGRALQAFFSGDIASIRNWGLVNSASLGFLASILVIMLPVGLGTGMLVLRICGIPQAVNNLEQYTERPKPVFMFIMVLLFAEEVFARWLFLGVLPHINDSHIAYYIYFLLGNAIWAGLHLYNYPVASDQQLLRVLPQFVIGIFLTIVYLLFGFLAALLVHIAYDMLISCLHKLNKFNSGEIYSIIYNAAVALIAWLVVHPELGALRNWLHFDGQFALPGWRLQDYIAAMLIVTCILTVLGDIFLYDVTRPSESARPMVYLLWSVFTPVIVLGLYLLTDVAINDVAARLFTVAIVILCVVKTSSGSALAGHFWISVPRTMTMMCALLAVGLKEGIILAVINIVLGLPERTIRYKDNE